MDAIGAHPGSVVGDIGAGGGYFTFLLAERVGPTGKVYAEDIVPEKVAALREAAEQRHLSQIEALAGTPSDPRLPSEALDAILVVNAYHEFLDYDAMQRAMYGALKPGGLLAIIDCKAELGQPRALYQREHRLPEQITLDDARRNGFHFLRRLEGFSDPDSGRAYYFLLFDKAKPAG
jgi:predicted methyltransferase